ncbi:hypothetical protein [Arthrobacter sp. CJ23]|uniref:hypothetical protein n=1 Tax=Arthrobacter sp. CJ23 TaxID=2972479 RepID=UPI00215D59B6|nr:hypothetical protein [Arthrobacter sp. CJ23]UVJ39218.1 hypothetical protein NVV90_18765 [Arthrobacter sp. CJ23]
MTFYGADVNQLRALAKAADKAATLLSNNASSLQGQIMAAPWKGNDGENFRQDWTSRHHPGIERVVASLRENSRVLLRHAEEQENASSASTGGSRPSVLDKLTGKIGSGLDWLQERAREAAAAEKHRNGLEAGLEAMANASPEEQANWWAGLSAEDRKYLIEGEGEGGPLALQLMKMDGGIPDSAQDQARKHLQELATSDIPVSKQTDKATLDWRAAWLHGGAEVGAEVVENADGTATMKVYGNLGLGVNDTSGTAGVTLEGEASREYSFDSVEEARAARDQMYKDLPPDSIGEVKDAASNTPDYVLDTINEAADDNGSTGQQDKVKGSLSLDVEAAGAGSSANASLSLSYEKNLGDGTSTGTGEATAAASLDLDGQTFEASGKGALEVKLDKDNRISSVALSMEGTVAQGFKEGVDLKTANVESSITAGTQGTVKVDIAYTPENKALIDSYLQNVAMQNHSAAADDAAKLYDAGSATVQVNSVLTAKNEAGADFKAGEVKLSTESQTTTNVTTYHKVPNDGKLERL